MKPHIWAVVVAAGLLLAAVPVRTQGMGDNSAPKSLDAAAEFLSRMALDNLLGVRVETKRGEFLYHGTIFAMERPSRCTLRFLVRPKPTDFSGRKLRQDALAGCCLSRTIDFSVRREVYAAAYNNVARGIQVTGPVALSDGRIKRGGEVFSMHSHDLRRMSVTALQFFVNSCSTPYGFRN